MPAPWAATADGWSAATCNRPGPGRRGACPCSITPYAFAATGALYLEEPSVLETSPLNVSSLGVGVSLTAIRDPNFSDASLTFEFGRAYRDDDEPDEDRFTVVGSFQF